MPEGHEAAFRAPDQPVTPEQREAIRAEERFRAVTRNLLVAEVAMRFHPQDYLEPLKEIPSFRSLASERETMLAHGVSSDELDRLSDIHNRASVVYRELLRDQMAIAGQFTPQERIRMQAEVVEGLLADAERDDSSRTEPDEAPLLRDKQRELRAEGKIWNQG